MPPLPRPVGESLRRDLKIRRETSPLPPNHLQHVGAFLGAVVGMHGDENGLIMPPKIAPFQVVICPMIRKNLEVDTIAVAHEVAEKLRSRGCRKGGRPRPTQGRSTTIGKSRCSLRLDIGPRTSNRALRCLTHE